MPDVAVAPDRPILGSADGVARGRRLSRRSTLPTGRAVVGGFLVAVAALGIFAAWSSASAGPTTTYVVARRDLPIGSRLTADDLTSLPMDLPEVVAARAVFRTEALLLGATTVGPVRRGELVQASDVVRKRSAPPELEVSFELDSARALAGTLRAGERVDVLATFGAGGDTYTVAVVRQALVLDAGHGSGRLADSDRDVISVAVTSAQDALALTHALNAGKVTLVRATGAAVSADVGKTYQAPAAG
ncbi:MAG TPA: SAF domain-containing protein [Acidimicrobiales bacterium]|nr:SAF domain-containing protein [Acidimicrobiales bacterium]